jgi:hypothetical protein
MIAVFLWLTSVCLFADPYIDGKNAAKNARSAIAGDIKSYLQPYSQSISCNGAQSVNFLSATYTGSSDIDLQIDYAANGIAKNRSASFSGVSGVCANGIVKCSPNSWSGCAYFKWSFNGALSLTPSNANENGGCYCINASCGGRSASGREGILSDIAGSIGALIAQSGVSGAHYDGAYHLYTFAASCEGNRPSTNFNDAASVANAQAGDLASPYSILLKADEQRSGVNYDFSALGQTQVTANFNKDSKTFAYSYGGASGSSNIDIREDRIEFCEVEFTEQNTEVFSDDTTKNRPMIVSEVRECDGGKCPLNNSENLKYPCGGIDAFGRVLAAFVTVDRVANNMTCSSQ